MNRSRASLIAALVAVCVVAVTSAGAGLPASPPKEFEMPAAGPEHARLTEMSGAWDVEIAFWFKPGGPGVSTTATSTIRPLFDGIFTKRRSRNAERCPHDARVDRLQHDNTPVRGDAHREHEHHAASSVTAAANA